MPMLLARREPDHIAGVNFFNRIPLALRPPATGHDNQGLTKRMGVPCRSRAGLERDTGASRACRSVCLKQRVNAYRAGKPVAGPLLEGCEPLLLISILKFFHCFLFGFYLLARLTTPGVLAGTGSHSRPHPPAG